jgi:hypothetical protein
LGDLGRHEEALAPAEEAVQLRRVLARTNPGKRAAKALCKSNHCMSTIADRARRRTVCT